MKENILLISPVFFDYYKEIKKELENIGYEVDFIRDSASISNFYKAFSRINKNFVKKSMKKYYNRVVHELIQSKHYKFVILIAGMTYSFLPEMIKEIRFNQRNAVFILYQWDGEKNISYVKNIHVYFDRIYSFDRTDCENNKNYIFLPLFYINEYKMIGSKKNTNCQYDIAYIGTAHPKKYCWINRMSKELKHIFPNQFIYQYMPSKLKFFYHKLTAAEYKNAKLSDFQFSKLSTEQIIDIYSDAKCILDSPQHGQAGLTMRTIECLGAKRKLITTNKDIKNYDFYREENILIYSDDSVNEESTFFTLPYMELPKDVYEKYSIENWVKKLLEIR